MIVDTASGKLVLHFAYSRDPGSTRIPRLTIASVHSDGIPCDIGELHLNHPRSGYRGAAPVWEPYCLPRVCRQQSLAGAARSSATENFSRAAGRAEALTKLMGLVTADMGTAILRTYYTRPRG